jgi:DNA-directed RNA polymerase specialized sigma24 family protein
MPDDIFEREVLGEAHRACDALVDRVRGRVARKGGATAGELSQYAAAAFQAYAETLLRALMAAASRRQGDDVEAWVRRQFHDGLDSAGKPLREAVAESPHRHAVAQGLQQKMFEAELMLRRALKARFADATLVGIAPTEADALRHKAAG